MKKFNVDVTSMTGRMEKLIKETNRAIGTDGLHVEMLQVLINLCATLLKNWWDNVGRTGVFPSRWSEGIVCPLYKKVPQNNPETYRSLWIVIPRLEDHPQSDYDAN